MSETTVPVQHSILGKKAWKPYPDYSFAARSAIAQISTEELVMAASAFPLAFISGEQPTLVALLGLKPDQNLFVNQGGQWVDGYIPATFRAWPFKLLRSGEEEVVLGYDHSAGLLADEGQGEAFFGPDSEPTQRVRDLLQFLIGFNRGQQTATALAAKLRDAGVMEPWPLKVEKEAGRIVDIEGLLRVNEQALGALDDTAFLELRHSGALTLAYAQLLSMAHIATLGRLAQAHANLAKHASEHAAAVNGQQNGNAPIFSPTSGSSETIDWDLMLKGDKN